MGKTKKIVIAKDIADINVTYEASPEFMVEVAKRIWDVAAREFRRDATFRSKGCVVDAMDAYFYACQLGPKPRRDAVVHVVACINLAVASVGALERMRREIAPSPR